MTVYRLFVHGHKQKKSFPGEKEKDHISPEGLVVGLVPATLEFWVRHPGVLGSIPKREEPGKTGRHPALKYRVPDGSHFHPNG